jgi:hypothetical protein
MHPYQPGVARRSVDGEWGAIAVSQLGCSGTVAVRVSVEIIELRNIVAGARCNTKVNSKLCLLLYMMIGLQWEQIKKKFRNVQKRILFVEKD